jgi:quercetin dioxygenase-like cupin family protein
MKIVRHQDIAGAELRSAETFTGQAWGNVLHEPAEPPGTRVTLVVFSPGGRSWWHSHDEGPHWLGEEVSADEYEAAHG